MIYEDFLNIADVIIRVKSKEKPNIDEDSVSYRYNNFILKNKPSRVDIDLTLQLKPAYRKFNSEIAFQTRRIGLNARIAAGEPSGQREDKEKYIGLGVDWRLKRLYGKFLLEGGMSGNYQVMLDSDLHGGECSLINQDKKWKISEIIYGFLQVLLIQYLSKYRLGILAHSCGLGDADKGYLFAGPTQAGKSTISRIWARYADVKVLNDDRIIIRREEGRFYLYSTPWHGDFFDYLKETVEKIELRKIFFISHSKINKARPIGAKECFKLFFPNAFVPFWDRDGLKFTPEFIYEAIGNIPCYKLGFKNDARIVEYIRSLC